MAPVERITLGTPEMVRDLYSFPNNCHTICFLDQTLEQTVAVYLKASIEREGFADSSVSVSRQAGTVVAEVTGSAGKIYAKFLPKYLAIGSLALAASTVTI